jgi:hypothetical protein
MVLNVCRAWNRKHHAYFIAWVLVWLYPGRMHANGTWKLLPQQHQQELNREESVLLQLSQNS